MTQARTFKEFIEAEITRRDLSARAFARLVGVDSKTINKFRKQDIASAGYPSVDFLIKLARATNTDISYLMMLVAPEVAQSSAVRPDAMILSQRIEQLPDVYRELIDDIIAKHAK